MEDLNPTKREEEFLRGIKLAAAGEDSSVPTPVWDYEKRLYDIWLAAKGEDPIYNLPVHTEHPDAFYNAIRDALVEGGGGGGGGITPTGTINITENGTVDVTEYATANVNVSGGSSAAVPKRDVNFYDYDGTIVASYTASEFASLADLPANPSHDGLTAQGWNWTLADAKAQVAANGSCDIGQMYITSDGKTRLYIHIDNNLRKSIRLSWSQTVDNGVEVDWGDGSEIYTTVGTGSLSDTHEYASSGDYVITLTPKYGTLSLPTAIFGANTEYNVYLNYLKKVALGSVANIDAFMHCENLESITIPNSVASIGDNAFNSCKALKHITLPNSVTSVGNKAMQSCGLSSASIPSSMTSVGSYVFSYCRLASITIPSSVTSIGANAFFSCYSLASITIPSSVTSIDSNAFSNCSCVAEYHIKATTPPTAGTTIFKNIAFDCKIYVPSASVDAYKAASGWSTYASKIYGE